MNVLYMFEFTQKVLEGIREKFNMIKSTGRNCRNNKRTIIGLRVIPLFYFYAPAYSKKAEGKGIKC